MWNVDELLDQLSDFLKDATENIAENDTISFLQQLNTKLIQNGIHTELATEIVGNIDVEITQDLLNESQIDRLSTMYADFISVAATECESRRLEASILCSGLSVNFTG